MNETQIIDMLKEWLPIILAAGSLLDLIAGYLPDKWLPYIGVSRRVLAKLKKIDANGRDGLKSFVMMAVAVSMMSGCAGIQLKTPHDRQIAELAVSVGAKALGLKMVEQGFTWTPEIETFYNTVIMGQGLTLDAAQLAEGYINDRVDPLLAPDLIRLAQMVGINFGDDGSIADVSGVDQAMLKIAAEGIRLAVTTRGNKT